MKNIFLFLSAFFFSINGHTQSNSSAKTLLWKITGPGIDSASYLYGTIHLMCKDDIVVSTELRAIFYTTQQLYLELDMDDPSVLTKTMQEMNMKNDTTLKQLYSEAAYDSVANAFQKITNIPLQMMLHVKPELIETSIYPSLLGCDGSEAWEQKFMQLAKANNMEIKGLEKVEDQLKIFDAIPYKVQAEELKESVLNIDSIKTGFQKMLSVYKQKDLDSLSKMINEGDDMSGYSDMLLTNRNKKWIPEIIEQAKLKPTFFAVGAGHLGNADGVINLLKEQGYTVTPVMY
ncbi:MAG: TraB/GumN family protein [Bacteroidetes bacterium]|nr:TraB/GumN family protein [Bacteroidota bacterium]